MFEKPVPKSSIAKDTPSPRNCASVSMTSPARLIRTDSVISSSSRCTGSLDPRRAACIWPRMLPRRNCMAETLTEIGSG